MTRNKMLHEPISAAKRILAGPSLRALPLIVLVAVGACNEDRGAFYPGKIEVSAKEFSSDEKVAARSLSIGSVSQLTNAQSPYAKAQLCSISLDSMLERIAETGSLSQAQVQLFRQAQRIFDERVKRLGEQQGKSAADMVTDRAAQEKTVPELSERGQIAIGCLRELASS